ncbi:MAG TPA: low temperature requirement protein A, partial [Vicinamibacterales bacterium]
WRYWCWAMAFAIDVSTAIIASRHDVVTPPHASHLPERFGLFTLILLGEAVVAIMSGIQHQPDWSVEAASTALSGIVVISAVWWGYFDGVDAAGHRPVRCVADSHRLWGWSAAHVLLYLGVALFGIAAEHAIRDGGWQSMHGQAATLSVGSVMLVATAFVLLRAVTPQPLNSTPGTLAHQ